MKPLSFLLFLIASSASSTFLKDSLPILHSAYYFPERIRSIIVRDFLNNNLNYDTGMYDLAKPHVKSLDRDSFNAAVNFWRLKQLMKRTFGVAEPGYGNDSLPRLSMQQLINLHYEENLRYIGKCGNNEELIQELYYAFKVLNSWNSPASITLSTLIFDVMNKPTWIALGPLKDKESILYTKKLKMVSIPAEADLTSYIKVYCGSSLAERIKRVVQAERSGYLEQQVIATSLLNPYNFNPNAQSNVFRHVLALQQWIRIQNLRLKHIHKATYSPLESLVLKKTSRAHLELLLIKFEPYPYLSKFFSVYFVDKMSWKMPIDVYEVPISGCDDLNINRKVSMEKFQAIFGLPDSLRALMFMQMQDDPGKVVDFVDAEFHIASLQQRILISISKGLEIEDPQFYLSHDNKFREVCLAWIQYWTVIIGKLGHFSHLLSTSPFLFSIVKDYFQFNKLPSGNSKLLYKKAIEECILSEANWLLAYCKRFSHNSEAVRLFTEKFETYERALQTYLAAVGINTMAFEANRIKIAIS